jgi:Flp pilus assembly protein protease CpaA
VFTVWLVRCCIVALAVAASVTDIRNRRVPDWLTLPPVALGLAVFAWRLHWSGVALWAAGVGGMAALLAVPWLLGGLGGGDFKMMLALGGLGGPIFGVQALAMGLVVGLMLFAVCGFIGAVRAWGDAGRAGAVTRLRAAVAGGWRTLHDAPPPFAVALGAGAVVALVLLAMAPHRGIA